MSKYNFKIENYNAIGHADIDIDGITVIAGGNGCGKSTLSRWLYYILNIIEDYEFLLMRDFHNTIGRKISEAEEIRPLCPYTTRTITKNFMD